MKKKIAFLLAALILTGVILFFLQALLMPKYMDNPDGALIAEYYQNAGNHDVIFIGDCEVYENFSPITLWEEYGITSYIRGSPQQLAWQSYYLMEETLKYEKPKVFVFNVLSLKYDTPDSTKEQSHREEYNRMALDGMRWSASKWNAIGASLSADERKDKFFTYASYIFPILRYHDRWSQLTADDFKYLFTRDEVSHNGYLMSTQVKPGKGAPEMPDNTSLGENSMSYLQKMADLCKENGVQLVLIKSPTDSPKWHNKWHNEVTAFARENDLVYLDMRNIEEMGLNWEEDTSDGGEHLNVYGAEKATRWFGAWLKKNFSIQWTQHDETVRALWAEKCETYHSHKKELEEK